MSRSTLTSPALHEALLDRVRAAIDAVRGDAHVALASKGALQDIIPGLSDVDFRLVLDTNAPAAWQRVGFAFAEAMLVFAHAHRDGWRLIEHMPAIGCAADALDARPVRFERQTWEPLWASDPHLLQRTAPSAPSASDAAPPTTASTNPEASIWWAEKLLGYQPPYDARRDPPINVAVADLPRFATFSLIWHYYAPAVLASAQLLGHTQARSKWDALQWRTTPGGEGADTAARALVLAEAGFRGALPDDLISACERDVQALAEAVTEAPRPWDRLRAKASRVTYTLRERRLWALATARTYIHRWWFYAHAPRGYDLAAVLKIDRGHIGRFTLGRLADCPAALDALREHARDAGQFQTAFDALLAEHQSTDTRDPRRTFLAMREHYLHVLDALETWHGAA